MKDSPVRRPFRPRFLSVPSQRLITVFVLFILLPGAFLGVFAFRVLRQEGQLAAQRTREDLERTAEELGRYLDSEFRQWNDAVRSAPQEGNIDPAVFPDAFGQALTEPGGGVFLSTAKGTPEPLPSGALLYRPSGAAEPSVQARRPSAAFAEAESLETAQKDYGRAIGAYRVLLDSAGSGERPSVLQRLARTLRKAGRLDESAAVYRELHRSGRALIGDVPSDLIARSELCSLAAEHGDPTGLAAQALAFYRDLTAGTWLLDKPRYLFYSDRCRTWCRQSPVAADEFERLQTMEERKLALARAVEQMRDVPGRIVSIESEVFLCFWHDEPFRAAILSARFLGSSWWPRALSARGDRLQAVLSTPDGSVVFGSLPPEAPRFAVTRDLRIVGTPWLLRIWPGRPEAIYADIRQKRTLSLTMLGFVGVLLVFGGYMTIRIVKRELEISRLRADFVSTVSHEFRSPLTGIRHLGEMLLDGRVVEPEKQRSYFKMIVKESVRLVRLVENVLDFSRIEEGRKEYHFEALDPSPWLRSVIADFVTEVAASGADVKEAIPDSLPWIRADSEALGSAVRNLLDNAVKYSLGEKMIRVEAAAVGGEVRISVQDWGAGISDEDRQHIFDRFYRSDGEMAKRVKGAGLGLSLVKHIVAAHGGTVECESRVGEGSNFTIRIPAARAPEGG